MGWGGGVSGEAVVFVNLGKRQRRPLAVRAVGVRAPLYHVHSK